jgi:hypothetical protein
MILQSDHPVEPVQNLCDLIDFESIVLAKSDAAVGHGFYTGDMR